jgi:hypothetical protein
MRIAHDLRLSFNDATRDARRTFFAFCIGDGPHAIFQIGLLHGR